ncbi:serine protease [Tepidimonas taiwanensis]|uniref:Trypsin-like peptidase domain protein n=1 Tax=Tepidimonas taiwanensis TaxID=307486 RepID=A0A554X4D4_9BURK|nr:serine protease [Tepidimonas taiwanensis]MDM7464273.1 serine protease [Tepidimonas taiwanensis]TSE30699.1 Trypsin-like peptidase domain protein [Tepidimonas taiwanensis]UBQ06003.1 serine protease [Tepidimonas taiwanensis]
MNPTPFAVDTPAKRLLFHTVRVETQMADGGAGTGTAFVVEHVHARGRTRFVVTNRHLVDDVVQGALVFPLAGADGQPVLGSRFEVRIDEFGDAWHRHPDDTVDLAVLPLEPLLVAAQQQGATLYVEPIASDRIADAPALARLDALEEVWFVGYPSGVWDGVNALPILRRGTTATPPAVDFEGQPQFLIDAAVYPGSSGSPVFVRAADGSGLWLAGVVAAVFFREESLQLSPAPVPASTGLQATGAEMIDLGLVIKAQAVREALQDYLRRWRA